MSNGAEHREYPEVTEKINEANTVYAADHPGASILAELAELREMCKVLAVELDNRTGPLDLVMWMSHGAGSWLEWSREQAKKRIAERGKTDE